MGHREGTQKEKIEREHAVGELLAYVADDEVKRQKDRRSDLRQPSSNCYGNNDCLRNTLGNTTPFRLYAQHIRSPGEIALHQKPSCCRSALWALETASTPQRRIMKLQMTGVMWINDSCSSISRCYVEKESAGRNGCSCTLIAE